MYYLIYGYKKGDTFLEQIIFWLCKYAQNRLENYLPVGHTDLNGRFGSSG